MDAKNYKKGNKYKEEGTESWEGIDNKGKADE